jgi:transposase
MLIRGSPFRAVTTPEHKIQDSPPVFRKKLSRGQVLDFLSERPRCIVAMEACATAHDWAREIGKLGHTTKLIPPQYVKPYVKRQKNDSADAEAITEAVSRRNMRFVEVKTEDQQVSAMSYRTRQMFIGQRTQTINALRSHLSEHGVVAPKSEPDRVYRRGWSWSFSGDFSREVCVVEVPFCCCG